MSQEGEVGWVYGVGGSFLFLPPARGHVVPEGVRPTCFIAALVSLALSVSHHRGPNDRGLAGLVFGLGFAKRGKVSWMRWSCCWRFEKMHRLMEAGDWDIRGLIMKWCHVLWV